MRLFMGLLRLGELRKRSNLPEAAGAEHRRLNNAMQTTDSQGLWGLSGQQRTQQRRKRESADCRAGQHTLQGMPLLHPMAPRTQVLEDLLRLEPSMLKSKEAQLFGTWDLVQVCDLARDALIVTHPGCVLTSSLLPQGPEVSGGSEMRRAASLSGPNRGASTAKRTTSTASRTSSGRWH